MSISTSKKTFGEKLIIFITALETSPEEIHWQVQRENTDQIKGLFNRITELEKQMALLHRVKLSAISKEL